MLFKKLFWIPDAVGQKKIRVGNYKWLPYPDDVFARCGYPVYLLKEHYRGLNRALIYRVQVLTSTSGSSIIM
jgi:hypothetical protein